MSEHPVTCVFTGGTLHGVRQGRLTRGFAPATLMEPVYEPVGKDGDCLYKNITHRQVYVRDHKLDVGGAVGYRLGEVVSARGAA